MNFSLNEMEATAKRATRGAGYGWGQAEEASKAARWLCLQGLDGAETLAQLLGLGLTSTPDAHRPRHIDGPWQAERQLCPLSVGPMVSDFVHLLKASRIEMRDVATPALLLPFASHAAHTLQAVVSIELDDMHAVTDGHHLMAPDNLPASAQKVVLSQGGTLNAPRKHRSRAYPSPEAWAALNRFAHLTYAPATEESRLLGAGAGDSDND